MSGSGSDPDPIDRVLALDIGGTKMAVSVVDANGRVLASDRATTLTGDDDGAEAIFDRLLAACEGALDRAGRPRICGIGVGCVGPMKWPEGVVSPVNIKPWREFDLRGRLADAYPGIPVRVHNDAVAMAIAEHWSGAGRGVDDMLGMVVSTGIGGGLILGGRLAGGGSGNAGHVGHVVVEPDGPPCACGGRGCVEAIARGPGLVEWARARGWRTANGPLHEPMDEPATARELAADATAGDPVAVAAFERAGRAVGIAVASAVALVDVSRVIVGGGVSQAGPVLFEPLRRAYDEYARLGFSRRVRIETAALGQDAGVLGAAALVFGSDRYWRVD